MNSQSPNRRTVIQNTISDCVTDLLFYDRKEDERLPSGAIEAAIAAGEITLDEMVTIFRGHLVLGLSVVTDACSAREALVGEVLAELRNALDHWPPFNSAHEGYAVLAEEMDELWAHVKTNQMRRDLQVMRKEAIQVAAMAIRFALEVSSEETGRK